MSELAVRELAVRIQAEHGLGTYTSRGWKCLCGETLPHAPGVYLVHILQVHESAVRKQVEADILAERGKQSQHWRIYNACARIARDGADE